MKLGNDFHFSFSRYFVQESFNFVSVFVRLEILGKKIRILDVCLVVFQNFLDSIVDGFEAALFTLKNAGLSLAYVCDWPVVQL